MHQPDSGPVPASACALQLRSWRTGCCFCACSTAHITPMSQSITLEELRLLAALPSIPAVPQRSFEWHCHRALRITASDVAAAVGLSRHEDAQQLAQRKVAIVQALSAGSSPASAASSDYQARCLQWGVDNEGNAAQAYLAAMQQSFPTSGYSLQECSLSVLSGHPHTAASPDRLILIIGQPDGLLQCKCPYSAEIPEQCPQEYRI